MGAPAASSDPKVTVVIPVFNPGPYLDATIDSMLGQSLRGSDREIILVDDGSAPADARRLDGLADGHPDIAVIHLAHSGSPGRPRNVGIAAARGEYIQLVDADDAMPPDALERLYEAGRANGSDIVIGKLASDFRGVALGLFRTSRAACTVADAPLFDSLGPVKMYRSGFLRQHGLRFPEDRRWLEDQPFVVAALLRARVVSVLADRVYYLHRRRADGANLGSIALEPGGYAASVRAVVEAVLENSEPGPVRERAVRRILREEILGRLDGPEFLAATATFRTALVAALGEVVGRMVDPAVDEELGAVARRRARLLRDGDVDGLVDLAGWSQDVRGTVDLRSLVWRRGRLVMALSARLVDGTGRPVAPGSIARGRAMVAPGTDGSAAGVSHVGPAAATTIQVYLRDPVTGAEWLANTRAEDGAADSSDGTVDAVARFDPLQVAGGRPLASGRWDVVVRLAAEGLDRRVRPRLTEPGAALPGPVAALLGPTPVAVEVRLDEEGGVGIEVGVTELELGDAEGRGLLHEAGDGREIRVVLPVAGGGSPGGWTAQVVVATPAGERTAAAHLRPRGGRIALVARVERSQKLPPGSHALALRLPGSGLRDMPLGSVTVSRRGQVHVVGSPRLGSAQRFGRTVRRAIRAVRRTLRSLTAA